jgi:hypothetical protein
MNQPDPSPDAAKVLLDEAGAHAATVRRADAQFRPILLIITGMYLVIAALLSANPRGGNVLIGDGVIATFLLGTVGGLYLCWRIRAWSRAGIGWFVGSVAAFVLWNGAVIWLSVATGWWGKSAPGVHFGASAVVAIIPLVVAAWLIGRR